MDMHVWPIEFKADLETRLAIQELSDRLQIPFELAALAVCKRGLLGLRQDNDVIDLTKYYTRMDA